MTSDSKNEREFAFKPPVMLPRTACMAGLTCFFALVSWAGMVYQPTRVPMAGMDHEDRRPQRDQDPGIPRRPGAAGGASIDGVWPQALCRKRRGRRRGTFRRGL